MPRNDRPRSIFKSRVGPLWNIRGSLASGPHGPRRIIYQVDNSDLQIMSLCKTRKFLFEVNDLRASVCQSCAREYDVGVDNGGQMSLSKRILFGNDPANDEARRQIQEGIARAIETYKFGVATRRRSKTGSGTHWDSLWPSCVQSAVDQLAIKTIGVNSRIYAKTEAEAEAIKARAEALYKARLAERLELLAKRHSRR